MTALETLHTYIALAAGTSGLAPRLLAAQCAAERGSTLAETWDPTNNPADVSLGASTGGPPVKGIASNGVNEYATMEEGALAYGEYLKNPPPEAHLDAAALKSASDAGDWLEACRLLCDSDYAADHYGASSTEPGGLVYACLVDPTYDSWWEGVTVAQKPAPAVQHYTLVRVVSGDTLSGLAVRYRSNVSAIMKVNPQIKNPNVIDVGWMIKIPIPDPTC